MAKLSNVIAALKITGLDEKTLKETGRRLQEANFIKRGKTGRYGGAEMEPEDAAAMVLALVGAWDKRDVIDAGKTVALCGAMRLHNYTDIYGYNNIDPEPNLFGLLDDDHTFGQAISELIELYAQKYFILNKPYFSVSDINVGVIRTPWPTGYIKIWGSQDGKIKHLYTAWYKHPAESKPANESAPDATQWLQELNELFGGKSGIYETDRRVSIEILEALGNCIRGDTPNDDTEDETSF
jgi:hypothetical protein